MSFREHTAFLRGDKTWANLGAAAMMGVANNDTTEEEGFLWDARRGKALRDDVTALNSAMKFGALISNSIIIQSNASLDALCGQTGYYWVTPNAGDTKPYTNCYFCLAVLAFANGVTSAQFTFPFSDSYKPMWRTRVNGAWGNWKDFS